MLGDLQLGEFIYEQPAVGDIEYIFKHALTQEVAYNSVLMERRRATHQRTADAIEAHFAERLEDHFSELARHYLLTTDYARAIRYSQAAAQQAADRSAFGEASKTLEAALKLIEKLPDNADRLRVELKLRRTQVTVAAVVHGIASNERLRAIERACELSQQLGETVMQLHGLINLAQLYYPRGEPMRTLELGQRCLKLAEGTDDFEATAYAHMTTAFAKHAFGRFSEAVVHYQDAILHAKRASRRGLIMPVEPWSCSATQMSCVVHLLGRIDEALSLAQEGLHHAR